MHETTLIRVTDTPINGITDPDSSESSLSLSLFLWLMPFIFEVLVSQFYFFIHVFFDS